MLRKFKWYRELRGGLWIRFEYIPVCFWDQRPKVWPRGHRRHIFWTHGVSEFAKWVGKRFCYSNTLEDYDCEAI